VFSVCHKRQTIHTSDFTSRPQQRGIHLYPSCLVAVVRDPHEEIPASFLNLTYWFKWVKLQPFVSAKPCPPKESCIFSQSRYLCSAMLSSLNFIFEMLKKEVFCVPYLEALFSVSLKFLWLLSLQFLTVLCKWAMQIRCRTGLLEP